MIRVRLSVLAALVFLAAAVAVLLALGTWQVVRLREANANDAHLDARVDQTPLFWHSNTPLSPAQLDYRQVSVSGRWDNARTMLITNRAQYNIIGKEAVTPLLPSDGGAAVLVNRGWFPDDERDLVLAKLASEQTATVSGLARYDPSAVAGRRTSTGEWTRLDPDVMGRTLPYPVTAWLLEQGTREMPQDQETAPTSYPVQRYLVVHDDLPHLDYALTWYGLAVLLIGTAVLRFRGGGRSHQRRPLGENTHVSGPASLGGSSKP